MNRYSKTKSKECMFWNCDYKVSKAEHLFCLEHFYDAEDGFLRQCNSCDSFIDVLYDVCLDCKSNAKKVSSKSSKPTPRNKYQQESNPAWDKADKEVSTFFVYILRLNDGTYYAGQTNNLRRRMYQHKERNTTKSTKDKQGKLMWFAPMPTRDSATKQEVELKKLIDKNPSAIDERIIAFRDLIKEVDME
tara:strand:- start:32 stop:601 length:570 start_codon:yes stop_codon:yes gene_type:complete